MRLSSRITREWESGYSVLSVILVVAMLVPVMASAQTRVGVTAMVGGGLFVPSEEEYYMDTGTDIYPEIGLQLDVSLLRLGVKAGYIYRKLETYVSWSNGNEWYSGNESYTLSFLPVQAELLLAPLDAISKDNLISPYIGVMAGAFIPTGDNEDSITALSAKLGGEIHLEPIILYGDLRYTFAEDSNRDNLNAGGVMLVLGMGLRLGFP